MRILLTHINWLIEAIIPYHTQFQQETKYHNRTYA